MLLADAFMHAYSLEFMDGLFNTQSMLITGCIG